MTSVPAQDINNEIERFSQTLNRLREEAGKVIVGQRYMIDRLLMALIADGHILIEGLPGLAKTTAVKALSQTIDAEFSRVSFTPDLLPADVIGTEIYRPDSGTFTIKRGPVFTNLLLADEINRAPAKVQSALLEAMQERQVTIGDTTHALPKPFLVLATQNPIEQEGTYPLPEAQVDRFMLKLRVGYPNREEEKEIMRRVARNETVNIPQVITPEEVLRARELATQVYVDPKVEEYIVNIIFATREPGMFKLPKLEKLIEVGASPRATIFMLQASRVHAMMSGRSYVTPQDIKTIGPDILRHRVQVTYEAEAQELTSDDIIRDIFNTVDVP
jgi:MoxR-like ATPase